MDRFHLRAAMACACFGLIIAGCSGSGSGEQTGRISVGVSDHPMHDVAKVCIAFTEVELKPKEGPPIMSDMMGGAEIVTVNMLQFQGMNSAPLAIDLTVPAGGYQWVRLGVRADRDGNGGSTDSPMGTDCLVDDSYLVTETGEYYSLYIPSGAETGLKLFGDFIVPQGGSVDLTVEIDLMKSIAYPDGLEPDAIFRPRGRLVDNSKVGALTGTVDSGLLASCAEPSVLVFVADGVDATLDMSNYLTSVLLNEQDDGLGNPEYHYTIGFLLAGDYELALSCGEGTELQPIGGASVAVGEVMTVPQIP